MLTIIIKDENSDCGIRELMTPMIARDVPVKIKSHLEVLGLFSFSIISDANSNALCSIDC